MSKNLSNDAVDIAMTLVETAFENSIEARRTSDFKNLQETSKYFNDQEMPEIAEDEEIDETERDNIENKKVEEQVKNEFDTEKIETEIKEIIPQEELDAFDEEVTRRVEAEEMAENAKKNTKDYSEMSPEEKKEARALKKMELRESRDSTEALKEEFIKLSAQVRENGFPEKDMKQLENMRCEIDKERKEQEQLKNEIKSLRPTLKDTKIAQALASIQKNVSYKIEANKLTSHKMNEALDNFNQKKAPLKETIENIAKVNLLLEYKKMNQNLAIAEKASKELNRLDKIAKVRGAISNVERVIAGKKLHDISQLTAEGKAVELLINTREQALKEVKENIQKLENLKKQCKKVQKDLNKLDTKEVKQYSSRKVTKELNDLQLQKDIVKNNIDDLEHIPSFKEKMQKVSQMAERMNQSDQNRNTKEKNVKER